MESAVQTTPPMRSTASMPDCPARPRADMMTAAMISVVSVMPEMGVTEIMATAHADTAEKRNTMRSVSASARNARRVGCASWASTENLK